MNDATTILSNHTKKYNIPLTHIEHKYIEHCTDGIELERIYKELIGGEVGPYPLLEQLTLDRIRNIEPNSEILQQGKVPFVNSQYTDNISSLRNTINDKDTNRTSSISVINNDNHEILPKSDTEWKEHEQKVSHDFDSSDGNDISDESYQINKRRHMARQHRLNGNTAFYSDHYQQSIDLYTESLSLDENIFTYYNRAIAYFKLNDYNASIQDCFQVLKINPAHITALYHRALCYCINQQYEEGKCDLEYLLTIDSDNFEAQHLLNRIILMKKTPSNHEVINIPSIIKSLKDTSIHLEDEHINYNTASSMDMNIAFYENANSDHDNHNIDRFHTSSLNEYDDEDIALGDEAGANFVTNLSDDDGRDPRSLNVSPTMDDDADVPALINLRPLETPPITPLLEKSNTIDHSIATAANKNNEPYHLPTISRTTTSENDNSSYNDYHRPSTSHLGSTSTLLPWKNNNDRYMQNTTNDDMVQISNFSSLIQSWLHDSNSLQSNRRSLSVSDRPWSLNSIQRDIEQFHRMYKYKNAIEASKKMLQNGILDYHHHAEYISNTLSMCSECYLKLNDYRHAIQYATEALQYNKMDNDALFCRAEAFEKEKFSLFSYADYTRISKNSFHCSTAQRACNKLSIELNSDEAETWREKLPTDQNDDECFLTYLKHQNTFEENDAYHWYEKYAEEFYSDACFVLAIRYYTYCIELQSNNISVYLKRAACYLKVFEPQKAINDCGFVLKQDKTNILALYYKASAYKLSHDNHSYELTLKEYIKIEPHNQIVLAEYYTYRREQIPRKKRRIRINSISSKVNNEDQLTYEQIEQMRCEEIVPNSSIDLENITDIKEQCSFILHSFQLITYPTKKLLEIIIHICRIMLRAEDLYRKKNATEEVPFSYVRFCFDILVQLTEFPQIDIALLMIDQHSRKSLDHLIDCYSEEYNDSEKLNRLRTS
ncbi:unnamed protein product [Adineta steineri]|uniref:Uncharacterized protein n=1 Tax=Adineta steineri TaxID=433720 RepID=A0A814XSB9_9BILA|nr:unnamed protein product [Adineta steineri]CAF3617020.1 unnamed protein product [Adineta steineri]